MVRPTRGWRGWATPSPSRVPLIQRSDIDLDQQAVPLKPGVQLVHLALLALHLKQQAVGRKSPGEGEVVANSLHLENALHKIAGAAGDGALG